MNQRVREINCCFLFLKKAVLKEYQLKMLISPQYD